MLPTPKTNIEKYLKAISEKEFNFNGEIISSSDWDSILNKPNSYPPTKHNHSIDEIINLTSELNKKLESIDWSDVLNKPSIPSKTSDLSNDSGFIDSSALQPINDNLIQLEADLIQQLEQGIVVTAELANKIHGIEFEQEWFNKQGLLQGYSTIINSSHNGYFKTADSFVVVSFGGFGQRNTNYDVHVGLVSGDSGFVGDLVVYDKTLNGFKVRMTGSAPSTSIIWTLISREVA